MTAPAAQSPAEQGLTPAEEAVIAAVAVFLASVVAVKAVMLPTRLVSRLASLGLSTRAIRVAGRLTLEPPLTGRGRWGSPTIPTLGGAAPAQDAWSRGATFVAPAGQSPATPSAATPASPQATPTAVQGRRAVTPGKGGSPVSMARRMAADEPTMRARYLLNAAKRLTTAATRGEFTAGLRREQSYLAAHRRAGQKRAKVARAYDEVARRHEFLKWRAVLDRRTTPDCAALHNSIWHRDNPPFPPPGARHVHCRCIAVPATS